MNPTRENEDTVALPSDNAVHITVGFVSLVGLPFPTRGCISLANSCRNFLDLLLNMAVRRNAVDIVDVEF